MADTFIRLHYGKLKNGRGALKTHSRLITEIASRLLSQLDEEALSTAPDLAQGLAPAFGSSRGKLLLNTIAQPLLPKPANFHLLPQSHSTSAGTHALWKQHFITHTCSRAWGEKQNSMAEKKKNRKGKQLTSNFRHSWKLAQHYNIKEKK